MRYPNVVGVGCGNKYINNIDTGKLCIQVYVKEKYKKGYNGARCVPKYYSCIPTDIIETGDFKASIGFSEKIRPAKMGYNIAALPEMERIGTAGCIVKRERSSGNINFFILSCNHLMAGPNIFPIGTEIVQPGKIDNGNEDVIARLSEFKEIKFISGKSKPENYIDAAIAKITDINIVRPQIAFMRIPTGVEPSFL